MVFLNALQSMMSIVLVCLVGYVLAWKGWITRETEIFIPRFVTQVVIPPYMFGNVVTHFQREQFMHLIVGSVVPLLSILASFLLFMAIAWTFRVDKKHRGLFATAAATSNTLFIGIPVNTALFGDVAMTQVLLYFFGNTVFFWTIGNYCLASEGEHKSQRLAVRDILKRIFSPPLCGMLAGIAWVLIGLPLPLVLKNSCIMLGSIASPLALVFIGVILRRIDWKGVKMGRDITLCLICRLAISPAILIGMLHFIPLPALTGHVFIMQSSLPCMANIALVAAFYGADRQFSSVFVALSLLDDGHHALYVTLLKYGGSPCPTTSITVFTNSTFTAVRRDSPRRLFFQAGRNPRACPLIQPMTGTERRQSSGCGCLSSQPILPPSRDGTRELFP